MRYAYTHWEAGEKPTRVRWYHIVKSVDPDVNGNPVITFLCGGHSAKMFTVNTVRQMPARCYKVLRLCPQCERSQQWHIDKGKSY